MDAVLTGRVLKALREKQGLSQQQVADYLNVNRTAYVKYETGKSKPTRKLKELSKLYGVPVDFFWGNNPQQNDEDKVDERIEQDKPEEQEASSGQEKFELQLFRNPNANPVSVSFAMGKVLSLKDEKSKKLTLQIMDEVLRLSIPQLEALGALLKTIK